MRGEYNAEMHRMSPTQGRFSKVKKGKIHAPYIIVEIAILTKLLQNRGFLKLPGESPKILGEKIPAL